MQPRYKWLVAGVFMVAVLTTVVGCGTTSSMDTTATLNVIKLSDLKIGAIKIGDTLKQVEQVYGNPSQITVTPGQKSPQYVYHQGLILYGNPIWMITVSRPFSGSTVRGIHIGSTLREVEKAYPKIYVHHVDSEIHTWMTQGTQHVVEFGIKNGVVQTMVVTIPHNNRSNTIVIKSLNGRSSAVQLDIPTGWKSYHVFVGNTGGIEWTNPNNHKEQIVVVSSGNISGMNFTPGSFTDTSYKDLYNQNGDNSNPNFGVVDVPYVGYGTCHIFKKPIPASVIVEVWAKNKTFAEQILSTVHFENF